MEIDSLDDLIICRHCQTLQKKVKLQKNEVAKCYMCNEILYKNAKEVFYKTFSLAIAGLILFIIINIFPILEVIIAGEKSELTIFQMVYYLFNEGFIVVGAIIIVILFIAPLFELLLFIIIGILSYFKRGKSLVRKLLILIVSFKNWAMLDIFFISILVALVKLLGYAEIIFEQAFYALVLFVFLDIVTLKNIKPIELWNYYFKVYNDETD